MSVELTAYQGPEHQPFTWTGAGNARGENIAALLVHGFPGTPAEMRAVGRLLHARGWTVHGLLLPGFGQEFPHIGRYRQSDWLTATTAAARELRSTHAHVAMVGNSMGGALTIQAAAAGAGDALLLFAPFWRAFNRLINAIFPLARHVIRELTPFKSADFDDPELRQSIQRFMPEADLDDPDVQAAIRGLALPTSVLGQVRLAGEKGHRSARQVKQPVTVIQGRSDDVVDPRLTDRLVRRMNNVRSLHLIDGDHELVRLESVAALQVRQCVSDWAAQVEHQANQR